MPPAAVRIVDSDSNSSSCGSPTTPTFHLHHRRGPNPGYRRSDRNTRSNAVAPSLPRLAANELNTARLDASGDPATTTICVVGVGFVGESLVREFSKAFNTIGFDISAKRIAELTSTLLNTTTTSAKTKLSLELTTDTAALDRATHFLISVPTLLRPDRSVNLDFIHSALSTVLAHARPGAVIVLESSVSVGTTRALLGAYKNIFHCGMSPERVDPGRTEPAAHEIPKIISGLTPCALKAVQAVYGKVFQRVVPVSKPEVAEMTKLFENCYRMVNIAYVNEISDACRGHGIDPKEMIGAAATKPYGFQAFWPGLGVGGHCIPVNPYYLFEGCKGLTVLERATEEMWRRPWRLARAFHKRSTSTGKVGVRSRAVVRAQTPPRLLVVGIGFKPGQSVLSCSPGLAFAQALAKAGCARLAFYDPLVPQDDVPFMEKIGEDRWTPEYLDREFDGVAICQPQHGVDLSVTQKLQRAFVRQYS